MDTSTLSEPSPEDVHRNGKKNFQALFQFHDVTAMRNVGIPPGTIMSWAALGSRRDLIKECLSAGATLTGLEGLHKEQQQTVLINVARVSITEKNMPLLKSCIEHGALEITHFGREAAYYGSIEAYQLLMSAGLGTNDTYGFAGDALACAIRTNELSMVEFLLDNGASLDSDNLLYHQFPPMEVAAMLSSPEMIMLLASRGVQISNSLALQRAAAAGRLANMQSLLDAGADINEIPKPGDKWVHSDDTEMAPPIHYAVRGRSMSAVKFLLDRGADASLCDRAGRNLLEGSVENGEIWTELGELLRERLATPS